MPNRITINPPHRIYGARRDATQLRYTLRLDDHVEVVIERAAKVDIDTDDIGADGDVLVHLGPVAVWLGVRQVRDLAGLCVEAVDAWEAACDPDEDPRYVGSGL